MPSQLPELAEELKALVLETDTAELADLEGQPLGAVVWLGGCTGSFVSPNGLVITNHHCSYGTLQFNSTEDRNILEDGFLARSLEEELPARPGSRVYVAVETTDVTDRILSSIPDNADGGARYQAIEETEKALVAECEQDPGHRCRVSSFYGGMLFVLTKQLEVRDVRLVYAPAGSVGKYGGDVDNWMWPRHTGDVSFLRAYVGPDGKAADPAPDNVPLRPRHWLQVTTDGLDKGDLVLVPGYPGSTNRYRLTDEVQATFEWYYAARKELLETSLEIIERESEGRPKAQMAYAAISSYINNSLKNADGMLVGYGHSDMLERKRALEAELEAWIQADPERLTRWAGALEELRALAAEKQSARERDLAYGLLQRLSLLSSTRTLVRLAHERQLPDAEREPGYQERDLSRIKARMMRIDRSFDAQVDRALFKEMLLRVAALPENQRVEALDRRFGLDQAPLDLEKLDAALEAMYEATAMDDEATRLSWMEATPDELRATGDPLLQVALELYPQDREWEEQKENLSGRLLAVRPRVMEAVLAFSEGQGRPVYPDANSTLRVTFGMVEGYEPRDGMWYVPFTPGAGILEKDTGTSPFNAPEELLMALHDPCFGPYQSGKRDVLPVNFLSTVDTTGGNSGSPTLDGSGRLVGLLFDGNWESIISDWDFLPGVTRSIHVDIRYVLWVMDRVDGAWNLLREMSVEPHFENVCTDSVSLS